MKRTELTRTAPLKRNTGKKMPTGNPKRTVRSKPKAQRLRCSWSNRCKTTRLSVIVSMDERYCRSHGTDVADELVGGFIKRRDGQCLACSTDEGLQWAHLISRGARYIRWDEENGIALCHGCHLRFTLRPADWQVFVEGRFPGRWTRLIHREIAGQRSGASVDTAAVIREFRLRLAAA